MRFTDWEPVYERILADMGYSREEDEASVRVLKAVTVGSDLVDPDDLVGTFGEEAVVIGAASRLEDDVRRRPPAGSVFCSGSAVGRCLEMGIVPDAVVTDLDGDIEPQLEASAAGAVTFVHAHGDNGDLVRRYAGMFRGPVVLTTQSRPENTVSDFGGFTDGDRAACIALEMGCRRVMLLGFDFSSPYPKDGSDPVVKARKLAWAREVLMSLGPAVQTPDGPLRRSAPSTDSILIGAWLRGGRGRPMSLAYIVLLILLIAYIPIWIWVWRKPEDAKRWHLQKYGPCIMIKTQLGMKTMDRLAAYPRFWHAFGFCSKLVSAVLFLLMMYMLIVAVIAIPQRMASGSSMGIEYALAIPGFNPILPLSYGVVALFVAMVVHELGHGIQARVNGIRVESSGLLYGVVPLGAFVEPNEDDMAAKPRKAQIDVYAAGITVNTIVAVISIVILVLACGTVSADRGGNPGVFYVDADSPAYDAGIPASALIIEISDIDGNVLISQDQMPTATVTEGLNAYIDPSRVDPDLEFDPSKKYLVTYQDRDATETVQMQMGLYIKTLSQGSPADIAGVKMGTFLKSIEIDGVVHEISSQNQFSEVMRATHPGQTAVVTTVTKMDAQGNCETVTHAAVTLTSNGSIGYYGLGGNTSGMTCVTPDALIDKASNPFYGADSAYTYFKSFFSYLSGPFNGLDPVPDDVKWWYDVPGGDLFWMFVSLMYWLFWLDILLAISNALPTYVLDGGFIFAGGISWLLEKVGVRDEARRQSMTDSIAGSVSTLTLFLFMLVVLVMIV